MNDEWPCLSSNQKVRGPEEYKFWMSKVKVLKKKMKLKIFLCKVYLILFPLSSVSLKYHQCNGYGDRMCSDLDQRLKFIGQFHWDTLLGWKKPYIYLKFLNGYVLLKAGPLRWSPSPRILVLVVLFVPRHIDDLFNFFLTTI